MAFEVLSLMTKNQVVSFIKQVERGQKSLLQRYFEGWWQALIPALVDSSSDAEGEERPFSDDDSSDDDLSDDETTRRLMDLVTVMRQSGGLHSAARERLLYFES